jgi:hypothetical protein
MYHVGFDATGSVFIVCLCRSGQLLLVPAVAVISKW